jgi:hypothetical protein
VKILVSIIVEYKMKGKILIKTASAGELTVYHTAAAIVCNISFHWIIIRIFILYVYT